MSPVLIIARLTVQEAIRRRLVAAIAAITIGMVGLSAWGFDRLSHSHSLTSGETHASVPQALILFMFMFSFVLALSASVMAAPAVTTDAESGVLYAVLARPLRRSDVLVGKWLGLASLLLAYAIAVSVLEFVVVDWVSGFAPPNPFAVGAYLFAEGAALLTLTLLLSTRLSALATGVVAVALFGAAWLAGVVAALGQTFNISALRTVGTVSRYLVPTDGLWHGAIYYLQPSSLFGEVLSGSGGTRADPFFAQSPPSWSYLVWVVVWFVVVMVAGVVSFDRKEL